MAWVLSLIIGSLSLVISPSLDAQSPPHPPTESPVTIQLQEWIESTHQGVPDLGDTDALFTYFLLLHLESERYGHNTYSKLTWKKEGDEESGRFSYLKLIAEVRKHLEDQGIVPDTLLRDSLLPQIRLTSRGIRVDTRAVSANSVTITLDIMQREMSAVQPNEPVTQDQIAVYFKDLFPKYMHYFEQIEQNRTGILRRLYATLTLRDRLNRAPTDAEVNAFLNTELLRKGKNLSAEDKAFNERWHTLTHLQGEIKQKFPDHHIQATLAQLTDNADVSVNDVGGPNPYADMVTGLILKYGWNIQAPAEDSSPYQKLQTLEQILGNQVNALFRESGQVQNQLYRRTPVHQLIQRLRRSVQEELAKVEIRVTDQEASLRFVPVSRFKALFRGCAANDCATSSDGPWAIHPSQHFYFVYVNEALKGYIGFSEVLDTETQKPYLLVDTLQSVNPRQAILLLYTLQKMMARKTLPFEGLLIPRPKVLDGTINDTVLRNTLQTLPFYQLDDLRPIQVRYPEQWATMTKAFGEEDYHTLSKDAALYKEATPKAVLLQPIQLATLEPYDFKAQEIARVDEEITRLEQLQAAQKPPPQLPSFAEVRHHINRYPVQFLQRVFLTDIPFDRVISDDSPEILRRAATLTTSRNSDEILAMIAQLKTHPEAPYPAGVLARYLEQFPDAALRLAARYQTTRDMALLSAMQEIATDIYARSSQFVAIDFFALIRQQDSTLSLPFLIPAFEKIKTRAGQIGPLLGDAEEAHYTGMEGRQLLVSLKRWYQLGVLPEDLYVGILLQVTHSPDWQIVLSAVQDLATFRHPDVENRWVELVARAPEQGRHLEEFLTAVKTYPTTRIGHALVDRILIQDPNLGSQIYEILEEFLARMSEAEIMAIIDRSLGVHASVTDRAIKALGHHQTPTSLKRLLEEFGSTYLFDPNDMRNWVLRTSAAEALGRFPDWDAFDRLEQLSRKDPVSLRACVASAFRHQKNPRAIPILTRLAQEDAPAIQRSVLETLDAFPLDQVESVYWLLVASRSVNRADIRASALSRLKDSSSPTVEAELQHTLMDDSSPDEPPHKLFGYYVDILKHKTTPELVTLSRHFHPAIAEAALRALLERNDPATQARLLEIVREPETAKRGSKQFYRRLRIRDTALTELGKFGDDPEVFQTLVTVVEGFTPNTDPNYSSDRFALIGLAAIPGPKSWAVIENFYQKLIHSPQVDKSHYAETQLVAALVKRGDDKAYQLLLHMIGNDSPFNNGSGTQDTAIEALLHFGNPRQTLDVLLSKIDTKQPHPSATTAGSFRYVLTETCRKLDTPTLATVLTSRDSDKLAQALIPVFEERPNDPLAQRLLFELGFYNLYEIQREVLFTPVFRAARIATAPPPAPPTRGFRAVGPRAAAARCADVPDLLEALSSPR